MQKEIELTDEQLEQVSGGGLFPVNIPQGGVTATHYSHPPQVGHFYCSRNSQRNPLGDCVYVKTIQMHTLTFSKLFFQDYNGKLIAIESLSFSIDTPKFQMEYPFEVNITEDALG